jgi:hypothetical protein
MKHGPLGLAFACALLTLSVVVAFTAVSYFAHVQFGIVGVITVGVAACVCWLGATASLVVTGLLRSTSKAVAGVLIGIALRFGLPLAVGSVLQFAGGNLAASGIFGWIVVFYLLTLTVETTLSVWLLRAGNRKRARAW